MTSTTPPDRRAPSGKQIAPSVVLAIVVAGTPVAITLSLTGHFNRSKTTGIH